MSYYGLTKEVFNEDINLYEDPLDKLQFSLEKNEYVNRIFNHPLMNKNYKYQKILDFYTYMK